MEKGFLILWSDLVELFVGINFNDIVLPASFALWLILLAIPISRTDSRDLICGVTYILFLAASGITMVLAIPQRFVELPSVSAQSILIILIFGLSAMRWFWRKERSAASVKIDRMIEQNKG